MSPHCELPICFANLIGNDRTLPMRHHSRRELFICRTAENIEAQIVPHNTAQQPGIAGGTLFRVFSRVECGRLHGRPWRNPKWIDARSLIPNLSDMTAFL